MMKILNLVFETVLAVQKRQAQARMLSQLDERTLRDIGLENEANHARERARTAHVRFGAY